MAHIPTIEQLQCSGKRVVVRADLDVKSDENGLVVDDARLLDLIPTLSKLFEKGASKVTLIGHMGRPEGIPNMQFSLKPVFEYLKTHYTSEVAFLEHRPREVFYETYDQFSQTHERLVLLENLRFYKEEEANDSAFAEELSYFGEVYVNEAFASSHRDHASVVALPKAMKLKGEKAVAVGLRLEKEITELSKLRESQSRPTIFVISGAKEDKLTFLNQFKEMADQVLIGGRLPEFMPEDQGDPKLVVARLNPDKEDITVHSIEQFEQIIMSAKTIFVSGPVGKFEEPGHRLGTQRVFEAVAKSDSWKVAGGGDTTTAIHLLKLDAAFDWISCGGGASLEFVAKGTLPGIEALC